MRGRRAGAAAGKGRAGCGRLAVLFFALLAAAPAQATIRYAVSVAPPEQHIFHVTMTIPDVRREVTVQMPAWNALYQIRDFAAHVSALRATDGTGKTLPVLKLDKQTWRITGNGGITVQYGSYWDEPGPFGAQLNGSHAFINLATILCYVPERRGEDARIVFDGVPESWRVAVALAAGEMDASRRTAAYVAPSYDALVDAPVEIGAFEEFRLEGEGLPERGPIRVVVHGDGWNREHIAEVVRRIVVYEIQLMRGAPFAQYLFIYHLGAAAGGGGGGMEHANSAAITTEAIAALPSVTAHEFFHLWNVKRIRPQSLEPVDYTGEQWTRALWFAEGVTSTYGAYTLVRANLWKRRQFYDDLAGQITELDSRPARRWQSVEQASLDTWLEKYPLYRRPEMSISYYNKGQLLGVLLDIVIRDATDNRASLDDVMRLLNQEFARGGRYYRDSADVRIAAERVAGRSLEDFFSRYVAGTDELPYADLMTRAGLELKTAGRARAQFGFGAARGPEGPAVAAQVEPGSPAERAGVRDGDLLLTLEGAPFPRHAERWLRDHHAGEIVHVRLRREGQESEVSFALGERQERNYVIEESSGATDKQRRIREGMLLGTTDSPPR